MGCNWRWRSDRRLTLALTLCEETTRQEGISPQESRDLADGAAWLHASDGDQYLSLQELLVKRPAHLTEAWDGTLAQTAGGLGRPPSADPRRRVIGYPPVRLLASREVRGALWLRLEVMSHTIYESDEPPRGVATGWVPAHDRAGKAVVWFYSRD